MSRLFRGRKQLQKTLLGAERGRPAGAHHRLERVPRAEEAGLTRRSVRPGTTPHELSRTRDSADALPRRRADRRGAGGRRGPPRGLRQLRHARRGRAPQPLLDPRARRRTGARRRPCASARGCSTRVRREDDDGSAVFALGAPRRGGRRGHPGRGLGNQQYRVHQRGLYEQDAALRHARQFPLEIQQPRADDIERWFGGKLDHPVTVPHFPNATAAGAPPAAGARQARGVHPLRRSQAHGAVRLRRRPRGRRGLEPAVGTSTATTWSAGARATSCTSW